MLGNLNSRLIHSLILSTFTPFSIFLCTIWQWPSHHLHWPFLFRGSVINLWGENFIIHLPDSIIHILIESQQKTYALHEQAAFGRSFNYLPLTLPLLISLTVSEVIAFTTRGNWLNLLFHYTRFYSAVTVLMNLIPLKKNGEAVKLGKDASCMSRLRWV